MPLSRQDLFPVVSSLKQLKLSPPHKNHIQGEEMVTDKDQAGHTQDVSETKKL